jgi:hypothetical protein
LLVAAVQDDAAEEGYDVLPDVQRQQQQQQQPADAAAGSSSGSVSGSAGSSGSGGTSGSGSSSADDEVARVQAFLGAEQDMLSARQQQQCELQMRLVCTFTALPRDLQVALISSPARRQLLDDAVAALEAGSSDGAAGAGGSDLLTGLQQLQQLMQELTVDSS